MLLDFKHFVNAQPTVRFAGFKEGRKKPKTMVQIGMDSKR
jgi:hypothetical protein